MRRLVVQQDWDSETSLNCAENIENHPSLLHPAIKSGRGSPPGVSHACEVHVIFFLCIKSQVQISISLARYRNAN